MDQESEVPGCFPGRDQSMQLSFSRVFSYLWFSWGLAIANEVSVWHFHKTGE